jgi:pSer/pThr/pTyr-binding forkhead associated (FHA) protein
VITLIVLAGPDAGSEFTPESDPITIGRGSGCEVMLHDAALGRRHCEIRREGGRFLLADLRSVNGTFVNDQPERVTTQVLKNHDEISFGRSRIRVELPESQEESVITPPPPLEKEVPPSESPPLSLQPRVTPLEHEDLTVGAAPLERFQPYFLLRVIEGADAGKAFEPKPGFKRFTVGRGQTADFILTDRRASRIHFTIEATSSGFYLIDEGSLNGTYINNAPERVSRAELHGGEVIHVSETRLRVEITPVGEATLFTPLPPLGVVKQSSLPAGKETAVSIREQRDTSTGPPIPSDYSRTQVIFMVALLATASCLGLLLFDKPTFFTSGPVSAGHANWEGQCLTCHPPWGVQPINATCGTTGCHTSVLQVNAHVQDNCLECHTEHRGRGFNITGDAARCWTCHETDFQDRLVWRHYKAIFVPLGERARTPLRLVLPSNEATRRAWQQSLPQSETGLIFAHTAHARDSGQENCLACHQPLPGEVINALGAVSAFPSHEECIDCHQEVEDRNPQPAKINASARCGKCHTRDDGRVSRPERTLPYVQFSHDNHKTADCTLCHFAIASEQIYGPASRSEIYPLPMDACLSCHQEQRATVACLDCHRVHHRSIPPRTGSGWLQRISLSSALLVLLALEVGAWAYLSRRAG